MHDFGRIKQDLQESLSLDKHPVAVLIGAGCPVSIRIPNASGGTDPLIPDVAGLTSIVGAALGSDARFIALVKQFADDGAIGFTIEDLLSRVRTLRRIVGNGDARGLSAKALTELEQLLCTHVADAVRKELPHTDTPYHHLVDWVGGVPRKRGLEIFTTNYDLLIEQAFEERGLPFFDGFVGSRNPFFDLRAIEDDPIPQRWTRVWKLHGCVNWRLMKDGIVIRSQNPVASGDGLLIHPSELKYDQSRRMPYLAMIDRLRHFLRQPSAFLVTTGYSFADEHLNEVILQGLRSNPTAAAFGLLYREFSDEPGAARLTGRVPANLTILAQDQGIVRSRLASWLPDTSSGSLVPVVNKLGDFLVFAEFLRALGSNR